MAHFDRSMYILDKTKRRSSETCTEQYNTMFAAMLLIIMCLISDVVHSTLLIIVLRSKFSINSSTPENSEY